MTAPLFSIIIPVYNGEKYITRAIDSIYSQKGFNPGDREIVVINDGSTDSTSQILKGYGSEAAIIDRKINRGLVHSVNEGIRRSRGRYIIRLDADDELCPRSLCTHQTYLAKTKADFTFSDHLRISSKENKSEHICVKDNYLSLIAIGIAFNREVFKKAGYYNEMFWEEHDFMLKVISKGFKGAYIGEPLIKYYQHDTNMTKSENRCFLGWIELIDKWGEENILAIGYCPQIQKVMNRDL